MASSIQKAVEKMLSDQDRTGAFPEPTSPIRAIKDVHGGERMLYDNLRAAAEMQDVKISNHDLRRYLTVLAARIEMAGRMLDRLEAKAIQSN